jgi:hypothetical protein
VPVRDDRADRGHPGDPPPLRVVLLDDELDLVALAEETGDVQVLRARVHRLRRVELRDATL